MNCRHLAPDKVAPYCGANVSGVHRRMQLHSHHKPRPRGSTDRPTHAAGASQVQGGRSTRTPGGKVNVSRAPLRGAYPPTFTHAQLPLVLQEASRVFQPHGSTPPRWPEPPRRRAGGCDAWSGHRRKGKPGNDPQTGQRPHRTKGNSRQYLQREHEGAVGGGFGKKQVPGGGQERLKAGQKAKPPHQVAEGVGDGLGGKNPGQRPAVGQDEPYTSRIQQKC